jgi:hypothetical protein
MITLRPRVWDLRHVLRRLLHTPLAWYKPRLGRKLFTDGLHGLVEITDFVTQLERTAELQRRMESTRERDGHDVDGTAPLTSIRILLAAQELLLYHWRLSLPHMVPLDTSNLQLVAVSCKVVCSSSGGSGGGILHDQENFLAREVQKLVNGMRDIAASVPSPRLDDGDTKSNAAQGRCPSNAVGDSLGNVYLMYIIISIYNRF